MVVTSCAGHCACCPLAWSSRSTDEDFESNGLNCAIEQNVVSKLYVYFSAADDVLKRFGGWSGYGKLGLVGPKHVSSYALPDVERVQDDRQTHGSWLSGEPMARIMEAVAA